MLCSAMYLVPTQSIETELIIKKSRFIARAGKAADRADAMRFVERARNDYTDASHHCWAYVLGSPDQARGAAMSDDGEPSSTAGKPILNVIQHKQVGDIIVVVTRYFGGIKLGAGGLVRAYSNAAQKVMDRLPTVKHVHTACRRLRIDYAQEQSLRHWLSRHGGSLIECEYEDSITCEVKFPADECGALLDAARERGWAVEHPDGKGDVSGAD